MKTILLCFLLMVPSKAIDYEWFENPNYGIRLKKPKKWIYWKKQKIRHNIGQVKFSREDMAEILANNDKSIHVATFAKYHKGSWKKLKPLVYIAARPNITDDFDIFFQWVKKSVDLLRTKFIAFKYLDGPRKITLKSGKEAVYVNTETKLKTNWGKVVHSKSIMIAVPMDGYLLQLNFTDGFEKEDCSEIFETMINSMEIN